MISSPGIGSGLDVNAIITQLMAVEQQPLLALQQKKTKFNEQISAFGQIKSAFAKLENAATTLKDSNSFRIFKATSSDETIFTASADSNTTSGQHSIEVFNLAQHHRLSSTAFSSETDVVGTGTLTFSSGDNTFQLTIDSNNNTLAGIRDAINNATNNSGITASIVNADAGSHLVLRADASGVSNALQITVAGDGEGSDTDTNGLSRLVYQTSGTQNMNQLDAALDASLEVDGFAITSASNKVSGALTGVTFNLNGEGLANLTLQRDTVAVESALKGFVKDYNALHDLMGKLRADSFAGDSFLLNVERQMRRLFSDAVSGDFSYLFDIGFSFDKDGVLSLDSGKLSNALSSNLNGVAALFSQAGDGFAVRLLDFANGYTKSSGLIEAKTNGLNASIGDIDDRVVRLDVRLQRTEERLLAQFSALDALMGSLSATSNFINQQLTALSSINARGNS